MFKVSGKWLVASGKGARCARWLVAVGLCWMLVSGGVGAETVRDPTRPPQSVQSAEPAAEPVRREYVLQSTRVSGALRSAVINNQVVRAGDRVGEARVLSVDLAQARLRDARGEFTLRLALPQVTRPARHTQAPREAKP